MYDAGPNIPFSLGVTNNSVALADPGILLATGAAASRPINPADLTGLPWTITSFPRATSTALAYSTR